VLFEFSVGTAREEHARHPAAADFSDDGIRADTSSYLEVNYGACVGHRGGSDGRRWRRQVVTRVVDAGEQRLHFTPQLGRVGTQGIEQRRPSLRRTAERGVEHLADALPAIPIELRGHAQAEPPEDPGAV